jgi:hypothetical protein
MLKYMSVAISGEPGGPKGKGELGLGPMLGEMAMNARFTVAINGTQNQPGTPTSRANSRRRTSTGLPAQGDTCEYRLGDRIRVAGNTCGDYREPKPGLRLAAVMMSSGRSVPAGRPPGSPLSAMGATLPGKPENGSPTTPQSVNFDA